MDGDALNMYDLKARMLIGTKEEMSQLLNVIDKQKISQLEKKIFRTLLLFKLELYKESNDSMDELIKDVGNLDLPNQAKLHIFRAEILDKLLQMLSKEELDKLKPKEGAIKALRKAIRIFRDLNNENYPYFGDHHFYLQIGDQFKKYGIYQDALESYQYIFEAKEMQFVYPNDWAIRIVSYFKYFEITQFIFKEKVQQQILENCQREIDKQGRQQVDQFKLDYYLGVNYLLDDEIDEAFKKFQASESQYLIKNQMKRNNKLINYVNKFITIKEPFTQENILIPNFDPSVYAIRFVPDFFKMQMGYQQIVNKRLQLLNQKEKQRQEWMNKISLLEQQINDPQQNIQNGELIELPNEQEIQAKNQQKQKELDIEKEKFKMEFQEDLFDVYEYFKKNECKYQPSEELLNTMDKLLEIIKKIPQNVIDNSQNIYQYCCFEFIQIEKYDFAKKFLKYLKDKGFAIAYILILFLSQDIEVGLDILQELTIKVLEFDIKLEQGFILSERKHDFYLKILNLMADDLSQQQDYDQDTYKLNQELGVLLIKYCKEDYYKYLFQEIESRRFYDPFVYEFKDKLFTYLFNRKKGNMQAIFSNGKTYVKILQDTKDSWSVDKEKNIK